MLDVLFKQNPLACLPQISLGICWTNVIGFCDIAFIAEYKAKTPHMHLSLPITIGAVAAETRWL